MQIETIAKGKGVMEGTNRKVTVPNFQYISVISPKYDHVIPRLGSENAMKYNYSVSRLQ